MKLTKFWIELKKFKLASICSTLVSILGLLNSAHEKKSTSPLKFLKDAFSLTSILDVVLEFNRLEVSCPEVRTGIYNE